MCWAAFQDLGRQEGRNQHGLCPHGLITVSPVCLLPRPAFSTWGKHGCRPLQHLPAARGSLVPHPKIPRKGVACPFLDQSFRARAESHCANVEAWLCTVVSISLLKVEQLRLREGDSLIKDHTASEWESWDFDSSQSVCRACAVSK